MASVWFITGCSSGLGRSLVEVLLEKNERVVATARNSATLTFSNANEHNFLAQKLDVTSKTQIDAAFEATLKKFGRIDVVVNNAGYVLAGVSESLSDQQMRHVFDTNYFGTVDVTRKALKVMRTQQPPGGIIQQTTSLGGQLGRGGMSAYCATKWAIEGFSVQPLQCEKGH